MKERIRLLAEQAGWMMSDDVEGFNTRLEKFAELIIQECAETVQDFADHRIPASEYPDRLKRYFGVEE